MAEKKVNFRSGNNSFEKIENRYGWIFTSAALVLLGIFLLYPIGYSVYLATQSTRNGVTSFVGLGNFTKLFNDDMFITALENTIIFLVIQVPLMLILALILAAILNNKNIKFRGVFRTGIFLPAVTSLVSYSILFKMLFSGDGPINMLLGHFGIEAIPWLQDPFWAKVTLIIAMTWKWTGYNMVFYLSGLQNVPDDLYEAADIDGASKLQQFFYITIPMLKPIIVFTTVMSTIGTLQLFDDPMNISGGAGASTVGPANSLLTLSIYIYNVCFKFAPNFGYAASISYVIVAIVVVLSIIQFKLAGDEK